jgi:Xaa-Pro aminopeptidase
LLSFISSAAREPYGPPELLSYIERPVNYALRQPTLHSHLARLRLDGVLITHLPNIRYLCGFTGSSAVLAAAGGKLAFFTDGRYSEQAREQVSGARIVIGRKSTLSAAAAWLQARRVRSLGIEGQHLTVASRQALGKLLPGVRLKPLVNLVEQARMVKEPAEMALLEAAVNLGSSLFDVALRAIRPGVPESAVAAEIEYAARRAGAQKMSFETIVAGGARSALPHGVASSQPIPNKGFVILDFGVILAGYCSDMTRTVHVGKLSRRERELYSRVREAQAAATEAVRPGAAAADIDRAARRVLRRAGLDRFFTHSTGHGVGLEIHEPPRLGKGEQQELRPGMVITIEPGIYIPGEGGVRIEDMVEVTATGHRVLTPTSKELFAL